MSCTLSKIVGLLPNHTVHMWNGVQTSFGNQPENHCSTNFIHQIPWLTIGGFSYQTLLGSTHSQLLPVCHPPHFQRVDQGGGVSSCRQHKMRPRITRPSSNWRAKRIAL